MDQLPNTRRGLSALLPSRKHFDVLAQELPIGVYELDAEARFVFVNERWSELTGVDAESAVGEPWASVVHPEDLDRVGSEWFRSQAEDRPFSQEFRYVRADGSVVWIGTTAMGWRSASSLTAFGSNRTLAGYVATAVRPRPGDACRCPAAQRRRVARRRGRLATAPSRRETRER